MGYSDKQLSLILDVFYDEYMRAPSETEFNKLTGMYNFVLAKYGAYRSFIESNGYELSFGRQTFEVIDDRGNICFVGTQKDIAEEYDAKSSYIGAVWRRKTKFRNRYRVYIKPFDEEAMKEKINKLMRGKTND